MSQNLMEQIGDLNKRIADLEQRITNPAVAIGSGSSPSFVSVTIDGGTGPVIPIGLLVSPPTAIAGTFGTYFNQLYYDLTWTAPSDGSAAQYLVTWAFKAGAVYTLEGTALVNSTATRIRVLRANTTYGFRVQSLNQLAVSSVPDPSSGWFDIAGGQDASVPAAVTGLTLYAGTTSLTGTWNANTELDVANGAGTYLVDIDTANTFVTANHQSRYTAATIISWNGLNPASTWFVRVAAVDSSGNQGPFSSTVSITPNTALPGPGSITSDMIVTAGLSATVITTDTMSGNRIAANTLDAGTIKTSSLNAGTITVAGSGAIIAGSPPTNGVIWDATGFKLYQGGVLKTQLLADGTASFGGTLSSGVSITSPSISGGSISGGSISGGTISGATIIGSLIETASSGQRIALTTDNKLHFYSGLGTETIEGTIWGFGDTGSGGHATLQLEAPVVSGVAGSGAAFLVLNSGTGDGTVTANASIVSDQIFMGGIQNSVVELNFARNPLDSHGVSFLFGIHDSTNNNGFIGFNNTGVKFINASSTFQSRNGSDSGYGVMGAAAFNIASSEKFKRNIKAWDEEALGHVRGLKMKQFQVVTHHDDKQKAVLAPYTTIGPVREEMPAFLQREFDTFDVGSMVAVLWKAVQELDAKVAALQPA